MFGPGQQRRGGCQVEQRRVLRIEGGTFLAGILGDRWIWMDFICCVAVRTTVCGTGKRSAGNPAPVPLLPSFTDAGRLEIIGFPPGAKLDVQQPKRLGQKHAEQKAGKELRTSKAL